jgi:hypothetical protein
VRHRFAVVLVLFVLAAGCSRPPDSDAAAPASAGPVATVDLVPIGAGTTAEPATVVVPAGSVQVQFRLAGLDVKADELTAELEAVGGDQIKRWRVDDVPPDPVRGAHAVVVPIYEARPGEYVLTVWAGDAEVAQRYRFRVQTP